MMSEEETAQILPTAGNNYTSSNNKQVEMVTASLSKKPRHRKKLLYQSLKKQIEFYFSDVNISKDRYMSGLLQESPYVDLSIFLTFNKVKAMTSNVKDIAKALQSSELLKVTDCGTKVFRTVPPQQKENSDQCTIYVEQLPHDADHTYLLEIFQVYGSVEYVSIPKFKHSGRNKGFAFVEFKDEESVKKVMDAFSAIGCCLSSQMDPGNLCSIKTFEQSEKEKIDSSSEMTCNNQGQETECDTIEIEMKKEELTESEAETIESGASTSVSKRKRKSTCSADGGEDQVEADSAARKKQHCVCDELESSKMDYDKKKNENVVSGDTLCNRKRKKQRLSSNEEVVSDSDSALSSTGKRKLKDKSVSNDTGDNDDGQMAATTNENVESNTDTGINEGNDGELEEEDECEQMAFNDMNVTDEKRSKKNRKRKKKHKKSKMESGMMGLQILSKVEWKSLRNKYLNEQRRKMKELKRYLKYKKYYDPEEIKQYHHQNRNSNFTGGCKKNGVDENKGRKTVVEQESDLVSGANESDRTVASSNNSDDIKLEVSRRLVLKPGLIVKVNLPEPILNKSSFKNEAKLFPDVQYFDVKEGSMEAYLRFSTNENAEQCVNSEHWANAAVLTGNEEKEYWNKITKEREIMMSKGRTLRKGRDKLLKKAHSVNNKHVWFD